MKTGEKFKKFNFLEIEKAVPICVQSSENLVFLSEVVLIMIGCYLISTTLGMCDVSIETAI